MIGLSLSICVQNIIAGIIKLEQVDKIITGTKAENAEDWNIVIGMYRQSYWRKAPDEGERIARQLIAEGKVEQPRLINPLRFPVLDDNNLWVDSEDDIRWNIPPEPHDVV